MIDEEIDLLKKLEDTVELYDVISEWPNSREREYDVIKYIVSELKLSQIQNRDIKTILDAIPKSTISQWFMGNLK